LLLDDPTVGVDVGSREEIYGVLRDVVRSGRAVVVITSDLLELLSLADRAVVMYRGRLTGEFSGASLDEQQVLQAALGAGIPAQAAASH
jgi:ABC-type sugar transport system ATPase subunit